MPEQDRPRLVRVAGRGAWHIYYRRRRVSTGTEDRAEAERELAGFLRDQGKPALGEALSISAVLDRYLEDRKDAAIPGLPRLETAHKSLKRWWRERPPEAITRPELRAYERGRATDKSGPHGKGGGVATVRTELQALRAALRWAHKGGLIATLPEVTMPPRPEARERWLTRAEVERLLASCERVHIRLFIHLALRTAARSGAILQLTWDRVDLEQRVIDFRVPGIAGTNKRRVRVPINDTLLEVLTATHAVRETEYVIEWAGDKVGSVKHGLHHTAVRAGVKGVTPHVLRHTAATWLAQQGVPMWDIAGLLGHTNPQTTADNYAHHSPEHLARATKALA